LQPCGACEAGSLRRFSELLVEVVTEDVVEDRGVEE